MLQARRAGVNRVFLPEENRRDFSDLPDFLKEGVDCRFVSHYSELYVQLFD